MVAKIQANLHARISTPHHQNPFPSELLSTLIQTRVSYGRTKLFHPFDIRHHRLGILAGGHDQPPAQVLRGVLRLVDALDPPQRSFGVELCMLDRLIEAGLNLELSCVSFQILDELLLGRVCGEVRRERHERKLAELLR